MDLAVAVEVLEALQHLLHHGGDGGLAEHAVFAVLVLHPVLDDVQKGAAWWKRWSVSVVWVGFYIAWDLLSLLLLN